MEKNRQIDKQKLIVVLWRQTDRQKLMLQLWRQIDRKTELDVVLSIDRQLYRQKLPLCYGDRWIERQQKRSTVIDVVLWRPIGRQMERN